MEEKFYSKKEELGRFLRGEAVPDGFTFSGDIPKLSAKQAEVVISWVDECFLRKKVSIEEANAFFDWLQSHFNLNPETAFHIIYYIQEGLYLMPDTYELCENCHTLYDSDEEGGPVNGDTPIMIFGKELHGIFPEGLYGNYCDQCGVTSLFDIMFWNDRDDVQKKYEAKERPEDADWKEVYPDGRISTAKDFVDPEIDWHNLLQCIWFFTDLDLDDPAKENDYVIIKKDAFPC